MAKENSFDIVSKTDYAEVTNAINQTTKEVGQRFDFKGSKAAVELQQKDLMLSAEDETKLRNMNDILQGKLVKRGVSLKALDYQKIEPAAGGTAAHRGHALEKPDAAREGRSYSRAATFNNRQRKTWSRNSRRWPRRRAPRRPGCSTARSPAR